MPIEALLKRCGSIYRLVILAAKRAKELSEGSPPLVETRHRKATSVALEEILQGKVLYKGDSAEAEGRSGKRGRPNRSRDSALRSPAGAGSLRGVKKTDKKKAA
ncbi:MAG: DNA-directed RNA polymerase subunit omega [Omnitrophica bacterium RIFCSPHIGHO2_02_FULL_63_14]|nr:MAG: DNA-directed RNA polymerase subunit omega [Omnitrophica bacterium RIFCSPHIGHO2_02_FULL_63_14]